MLIKVETLKKMYPDKEFSKLDYELLKMKLDAIETAIRKYTNNTFQNRYVRGFFKAKNNRLYCEVGSDITSYLAEGDTIQISVCGINNGICTVTESGDDYIAVDKKIYPCNSNLVTLVEYPLDIVEGAINILDWDVSKRDKTGILSETISRHSVSYQQYDGNNTIEGYPAMLFGFCKSYMRART